MSSNEEQIKAIEEEIRKTQYNKATQHHIGLLKAKIARLREKREAGGSGGHGYSVKKTGDSTAVLVGFPSVGKSTILNSITNAQSKIGAYAFTTLTVVPGVMEYEHAKIQILDVPGILKGASRGTGMGKEILSVVRNTNLIIIVTEPFSLSQIDVIKYELYKTGLRLDESLPNVKIKKRPRGGIDFAATVKLTKITKSDAEGILREFSLDNCQIVIRENVSADQLIDAIQGNKIYVPSLLVINKADTMNENARNQLTQKYPDAVIISAERDNSEQLKKAIFHRLKLMKIYLKEFGKKADLKEPMIVTQGCTIQDICNRLHRDFVQRFRFAKVWGKSAKFPGQVLHMHHKLKDGDVIQVFLS